jgi:hypothetical protein
MGGKKMKYLLAVVVALIFGNSAFSGEVYKYQGHRYVFVNASKIKWTDAKEKAEKMGGYLMCVESDGEQKFVEGLLNNLVKDKRKRNIWIGATDIDGSWKWVNGKKLDWGNWYKTTNEPNGDAGGKGSHYAHIFYGNWWNDDPNDSHKSKPIAGFFVEYEKFHKIAVKDEEKLKKIVEKKALVVKPKPKPKPLVVKKTKPKVDFSAQLEELRKNCGVEKLDKKSYKEKNKTDIVIENVVIKRYDSKEKKKIEFNKR